MVTLRVWIHKCCQRQNTFPGCEHFSEQCGRFWHSQAPWVSQMSSPASLFSLRSQPVGWWCWCFPVPWCCGTAWKWGHFCHLDLVLNSRDQPLGSLWVVPGWAGAGWNGVWKSVLSPWEWFVVSSKTLALPWHQAGGGKWEKGTWHQRYLAVLLGCPCCWGAQGFLPLGELGLWIWGWSVKASLPSSAKCGLLCRLQFKKGISSREIRLMG